MSTYTIKYRGPAYALNERIYSANTTNNNNSTREKEVQININDLIRSLEAYVGTFIAKGPKYDIQTFKWNLLEEMGIPAGSYIIERASDITKFTLAVRDLFRALTSFGPLISLLDQNKVKYRFLTSGHQFQVFWETTSFHPELSSPPYLHEGIHYNSLYKIHLTPKPEYAVFTILKIFSILGNPKYETTLKGKRIMGKILCNFRTSQPTEKNTKLAEVNGGATPMIVLYMNDNRDDIVSDILNILLQEFEPDVSTIGAMTSDYKYRILPFNIRLNSLIAYAQGDRCQKLDARDAFQKKQGIKNFFMPTWAKSMMDSDCSKSMQLFGKNICLSENKVAFSQEDCLDDICWITANPDTFLDPTKLTSLKDELVKEVEPADTSANNARVSAVRVCEAPPGKEIEETKTNEGGGRTRSKRRRVRKQKRHAKKTRKYLRK